MEKVIGKRGEKVLIAGSYKCIEHPNSWFFFNKNETFRLCPSCKNEHKHENTWFLTMGQQPTQRIAKSGVSHFLSALFSHF